MKKLFNKKNPLFLLILSVLLLAGTMLFNAPAANAATTDTVSMYYTDVVYAHSGGVIRDVYIKVANLDYEKNVSITYTSTNSPEWTTVDAEYVGSLDSNYDVFKATVTGFGSIQYYINYTVDGTTYTDNNNAKNYTGETLGSAPVCALRPYSSTPTYYTVKAATKNLGSDAAVKVVYTTDNWVTTNEASLSPSEKVDNNTVQVWYTSLDFNNLSSLDGFEYAICYTVDGTEYWDNNFGSNYDSDFHSRS